jgi:beta-xylosidase
MKPSALFAFVFWVEASIFCGLIGASAGAAPSVSTVKNIASGQLWLDTSGKPIQAHGGGVIFDQGTYYWLGEDKVSNSQSGHGIHFQGVRCYASKDLYNWKNQGIALAAAHNVKSEIDFRRVCGGPQVIYNDSTRQFVMWFSVDNTNYTYGHAGVAVSRRAAGPYKYLGSVQPDGEESFDMTLFKDDDGTAWLISTDAYTHLHFSRLTADYLKPSGVWADDFYRNGHPAARESPVVFKRGTKYYIITSGTTGWWPNAAEYAYADSMLGPWTVVGNPCVGTDADLTFHSQGDHVLRVPGKTDAYIYMGDRWNPDSLRDSRYVWLPIHFNGDLIEIDWMDQWNLSVFNAQTP